MSGAIFYLIILVFVLVRFMNMGKGKGSGKGKGTEKGSGTRSSDRTANRPSSASLGKTFEKYLGDRPLASDGHRMSKEDDISCRRFGHQHEEFDTPRFIPHDEPEEGYIILNGVKMKRTEADRYENRI